MTGSARVGLLPARVDRVKFESLPRRDAMLSAAPVAGDFLTRAIERVLIKIDQNLARFTHRFPGPASIAGVYPEIDNIEWTNGFWTGMLWLAYEATGEHRFRHAAELQVESFARRARDRIGVEHHDLGFLYTLSCVSAFKLTGNTVARDAALEAARLLLRRYLPSAGIIQAWGDLNDPEQRGRMIIDCNMNLPLLYWAGTVSNDDGFARAADEHLDRAAAYLVRDDASTFHTYYMDARTGAPQQGSTHQGYSDDSCWARGQAWGIYGFALGYRYLRDTQLLRLSQRLAHYFLNRTPEDFVCYWDLHFTKGDEPRDSSAAAIAACGLLELAGACGEPRVPEPTYQGAAQAILRSLGERYHTDAGDREQGLLRHAVYHRPHGLGVDESCIWGDYFYFEALLRLQREWRAYW